MDTTNAVTWFEIGSDRADETERFYRGLFGWAFEEQGAPGRSYRVTGGGGGIGGAIRAVNGTPNYAVFYVEVADVADTCRQAEAAGGRVLVPVTTTPVGVTFTLLVDPTGNHFGIFTPAPPVPADHGVVAGG